MSEALTFLVLTLTLRRFCAAPQDPLATNALRKMLMAAVKGETAQYKQRAASESLLIHCEDQLRTTESRVRALAPVVRVTCARSTLRLKCRCACS
jgi:hypothetical protein